MGKDKLNQLCCSALNAITQERTCIHRRFHPTPLPSWSFGEICFCDQPSNLPHGKKWVNRCQTPVWLSQIPSGRKSDAHSVNIMNTSCFSPNSLGKVHRGNRYLANGPMMVHTSSFHLPGGIPNVRIGNLHLPGGPPNVRTSNLHLPEGLPNVRTGNFHLPGGPPNAF